MRRGSTFDITAWNNDHPVGEECAYFPILGIHEDGKRTLLKSEAFMASSGDPVVFVQGISGYVSCKHLVFKPQLEDRNPTWNDKFEHRW
jgi:hypothetical protein